MNTILSHYHICETPPFGAIGSGLSGRITPKIAGSRRGNIILFLFTQVKFNMETLLFIINYLLGSSRPFDDIREVEVNELGGRYDLEVDAQSESASIAEHRRFRLLSPPKKVKPK